MFFLLLAAAAVVLLLFVIYARAVRRNGALGLPGLVRCGHAFAFCFLLFVFSFFLLKLT